MQRRARPLYFNFSINRQHQHHQHHPRQNRLRNRLSRFLSSCRCLNYLNCLNRWTYFRYRCRCSLTLYPFLHPILYPHLYHLFLTQHRPSLHRAWQDRCLEFGNQYPFEKMNGPWKE